ncbi:cyclopropane-fatty-acyl-phospholipid synthase [Seiridium cupressi]
MDAGFAESYMLRDIEIDSLLNLFLIYIKNSTVLGNGNWLFQIVPALFRLITPTNDPARALRNASFHYDTSNELFAAFLSPDMNYSSPIWDASQPEEPLEAAQLRKINRLIGKLELSSEHHLFDIGGGWGSLAISAACAKGCRVPATTLSSEQKELFDVRVKQSGLQHLVECVVCDYRNIPAPAGGYDRIVSVEMVEHVGKEHMSDYCGAISRMLKPIGGIMVVQGITIINKVGLLFRICDLNYNPLISRVVLQIARQCRKLHRALRLSRRIPADGGKIAEPWGCWLECALEVESVETIGHHYSKALRVWRENFESAWPKTRKSYEKTHRLSETEMEAFRRRWVQVAHSSLHCTYHESD